MVRSRLILILALLVVAAVPAVALAAPGAATLVGPSTSDPAWASAHFWRTAGTTPGDRAWVRRSAYALDAATAAAHPDWVLKDAYGTSLYLGSAFAGDFGNPAYRTWWIGEATAAAAGAAGLYVDDVSMERRAYSSFGYLTSVRDPRTGATMSEANWQRYMADFMVALRAALPTAEIVHDVLFYKGDSRADIQRELGAASAVALEKGFNDPVITANAGTYGWETLAGFVERRQASGKAVILDSSAEAASARLYGLATALLLDTGGVALANDAWSGRARYWSAYDVRLGAPAGLRYWWNNLWRRDFASGIVVVNPMGAPVRVADVGPGFADLDGAVRTSVTLPPGSATVLRRVPIVPTPTPTPAPVAPVGTPEPGIAPVASPTPQPRKPVKRGPATAHIAGAADPKTTKTTVKLTRSKVSGRVAGAVSGFARVSVQRKGGSGWVTVRRAKDSISKRGRFSGDIATLRRGTYRVIAVFEGTGTALPSRAELTRAL